MRLQHRQSRPNYLLFFSGLSHEISVAPLVPPGPFEPIRLDVLVRIRSFRDILNL